MVSRAQRKRLTYAELDHWSNAVANGLRASGVVKGDRVAVSLGNNVEFAVVCLISLHIPPEYHMYSLCFVMFWLF